ncbi:MAG: hypothetical protein CL484_06615 [Acidobacteria bacterium]|nr:hypothetical protein [Acidobacteriota bacterium]|tara:strand:+ start:2576 stop:3160 length:585 start_codon:yes stop_codon:yes gene_type:complete
MAPEGLLAIFLETVLPTAVFLLGVGFLASNLRLLVRFLRYWRLRSSAVLTWPRRRPSSYGWLLGFGVLFGVMVFVKIAVQQRPLVDAFGEGMMFIYYAYALPLSFQIGQGFYRDGVWSDRGFVPYAQIGGLSWREDENLTLVLIHRVRNVVGRVDVPFEHYGEVRRFLRDKIAAQDIDFTDKGFDLGADERELV